MISLATFTASPRADETDAAEPDAGAFARALEDAGRNAERAFALDVSCTDGERHRQARIFPGGAGAWNRSVQIRVDAKTRSALVADLVEAGFAGFAPLYGGQKKPEKAEAALRVLCRIAVEVDGLEKASAQAAYGEQFAPLTELAAALLDRLEPLAADGVRAAGLEEAIGMIARGELAPELLTLRLVQLPPAAQDDAMGVIVRLEGSVLSSRPYRPGQAGAAPRSAPVSAETVRRIAAAAAKAQFWALPVNVPGTGHTELEVQALGHDKTVIARDFSRSDTRAANDEGARLQELAGAILAETSPD